MARIADILAVFRPDRAYSTHHIGEEVRRRLRLMYPHDRVPEVVDNLHGPLKRLVKSGRLRYLPGQQCYALPLHPPKPKVRKRKAKKPFTGPRRRRCKPPSVVYRLRHPKQFAPIDIFAD